MGSQILRPNGEEWLIQGPWGRRNYGSVRKDQFYRKILDELIESGLAPSDSRTPSNRHHDHVIRPIMLGSWIEGRWVLDEPFAARLKKLRDQAKLTQEQLAEKSGLDVGTIRQLEQGTRTNPQWQTVCSLARGLEKDVVVFVGTDGWQPPDPNADWKRRQKQPSRDELQDDR